MDISEDMVDLARSIDPGGEYHKVPESEFSIFKNSTFDLILSAFTFDNIPTEEKKLQSMTGLKNLLKPNGILLSLVSSPAIYTHEWCSFPTKDFPQNRLAKSGDKVWIVMKDVDDRRPVVDILWDDKSYRELYDKVGLKVLQIHKPLAKPDEPFEWISETEIAPWIIYVLGK